MRSLVPWLLLLFCMEVYAQTPEERLQEHSRQFPQEKVVLSFSKPQYLAGETIHFKAYVLSGYEPTSISTNLYTELYDKDKKLLDSQLVFLANGSGDGHFTLPASLAEDVYYIRAYTRWMLNFGAEFQYQKALPVYNPYSSQSLRLRPVDWTAKAFVEGGTIINGAVANVAVRLFSNGSLPSTWTGQLVDKKTGTTISDISVYNNEIGQVRFLANAEKRYALLLKDDQGKEQELLLPSPVENGVVMQVAVMPGKLRYSLLFKNIPGNGNGYKLVGSVNNQPVIIASVKSSTGSISGTFDIQNLPAGILQLTLFDAAEKPVTERLCFLHHNKATAGTAVVQTDTLSFAPKGRNHWQVAIDTANWPSFALQVSDASVPLPDEFLPSVYLTNDLASRIYAANWYFEAASPERTVALDALLITEKWKRFRWEDVLKNAGPTIRFQPDAMLSFTGAARKANKPVPLRDLNLLFRGSDSTITFVQVKTDSAGRFRLDQLFFTDTVTIFAQTNKQKFLEREVDISFQAQNRFHPFNGAFLPGDYVTVPRSKTEQLPLAIQKAIAQKHNELVLQEKTNMLEAVVVTTKARNLTEELDKQLSSGFFSNNVNALLFDFVNDDQTTQIAYNNILEWLQGRVPGLTLQYSNGVTIPMIRNSPVQVFLDEMQVDNSVLISVSPYDVAMIKVIRSFFVGARGGGSAIAVYSRRGGMPTKYKSPSLPQHTIVGYQKYKAPVMPDYADGLNSDVKDQRVILFRKGLLQPDPTTQKAAISFYNNDTAKQYRLVITGFTKDGVPVYLSSLVPAIENAAGPDAQK